MVAGRLYDQVAAQMLFFLSAGVAFAALPLALRLVEPPREPAMERGTDS